MTTTWTVYHSPRWMELVEQGWITMNVITEYDGTRIAYMLRESQP